MITLTPQAAKQVRIAAEQGDMANMALRLAAKQNPDGSLDYGMGFDEVQDDDMVFQCEGIEVVFAPQYGPLLKDAVLDYVEIEPGQYHFIFQNPNDANCSPSGEGGGCGGGSCGGCGG